MSYRHGEDTFNNKLSPTKIDGPYRGDGTPAAGGEVPYGAAAASSQKSHGLVSIDPAAPLQYPIQNLIKITESESNQPTDKNDEDKQEFVEFTEIYGDIENCDICGEIFEKHH